MAEQPKRSRRQKVRESIARVQIEEGGFGGSFWYLFPDSIETHEGVFPLSHEVTATVDNEVRRQFAPGKALALGIFGLTKKRGSIYITVEGHNFHSFGTITFRNEKGARKFAAKVNSVARGLPSAEAPPEPAAAAVETADVAEEIRKLGALRDDELITPEEFEAKKKQLLGLD
jgi:Short C-terminal domain